MYLADLAAGYAKAGHTEAGLMTLAEALTQVQQTAECWYEAELYRLQGELHLLRCADQQQAAACFEHALEIARRQHTKSWELRAATSLARLWQSQGKRQEAYDLLAPVCGWFTEGFDTADLKEAQALLRALAS
jgi:predicted ATPase